MTDRSIHNGGPLSVTLRRSAIRCFLISCGVPMQANRSSTTTFSEISEPNDDDSNEAKIEALADIICRAGEEAAAALFVLMGTLENSAHLKLLACS